MPVAAHADDDVIVGQECGGLAVFLGPGAATTKFVALLFESVQPPFILMIPLVLLGAGADVPSKQLAALPYPTRSAISGSVGQDPDNAVTFRTNATLPAVAARLVVPVTSGAGSEAPLVPTGPSWIK
jgi:hypothetical protein